MLIKYVECKKCKADYATTPKYGCQYCGRHDFEEFDLFLIKPIEESFQKRDNEK